MAVNEPKNVLQPRTFFYSLQSIEVLWWWLVNVMPRLKHQGGELPFVECSRRYIQ